MEQYTVYCTEEQVKRAIKLGAPINIGEMNINYETKPKNELDINGVIYDINISRQLILWLRQEKGFIICTNKCCDAESKPAFESLAWYKDNEGIMRCVEIQQMIEVKPNKTYQGAIIDCIDRVLDELEK